MVPAIIFGVVGALSGPYFTTNQSPDLVTIILFRTPLAIIYAWMLTSLFDLSNQRLPQSIEEDLKNKPWRPIPSGRLTGPQMRTTLLVTTPIVAIFSFYHGVQTETAFFLVLNWYYNDLEASDAHFALRTATGTLGFTVINWGSLKITCGPDFAPNSTALIWDLFLFLVIVCTLHVQDLRDHVGDAMRGRFTLVQCFGDTATRWIVSGLMFGFCAASVWYTEVSSVGYALTFGTGLTTILRMLILRYPKADSVTYNTWGLWLSTIYCLPLITSPAAIAPYWPF